ncbi:MAG: hypothetical protein ACLQQ4_12020 [Bacteroidia bacterium]
MKKLSIVAALLFAFGTVAFAQDKAAAPAKKDDGKKTEKKETKKSDKKDMKKDDKKGTADKK